MINPAKKQDPVIPEIYEATFINKKLNQVGICSTFSLTLKFVWILI